MVTPPFLKPGDLIGVISTARKITNIELEPFTRVLESWGLGYEFGKSINAAEDQFAGDVNLRLEDLQKMLDDPRIKAIWCARGGYGTVQLIDRLDFSKFRNHPKWIIGYSDVTVLHSHINQFGIETLHANMAIEIDTKTEATRSSIKRVLFGETYKISIPSEMVLNRTGMASGELIGGNLSLLYSLCGSPSTYDTKGKILFIEDLDEYLYHIDRMMQNLKRNGMFEHIVGLIVGGMSDMNDNTIPYGKTAQEIIRDTIKDYDFPVCFNFPAGHVQDNRALIIGRIVKLSVNPNQVDVSFNA